MSWIKQPGVRWIAAFVAVVAALNLAVLVLWSYPDYRERRDAELAHVRAESAAHAARQDARELEIRGRDAIAAAAGLRDLRDRMLLPPDELASVLERVRRSAEAAGLRLERIDYAMEPVDLLGAAQLKMSVLGAGGYPAVRDWLATLGEAPGFVFVERLEISGASAAVLGVEATVVALLRATESAAP